MDGYTDRAWNALVRHADFADEPPVIERKRVSRLFPSLKPTPDERAEYEYELTERAGRYLEYMLDHEIDFQAPQEADIRALQEADRLALDDLGCVEFWAHLQSTNGLCSIDERRPVELSLRNDSSIPDDFDFVAWWDSLEARLRGDERRAVA
ncbi:MAG: hypothetical protein M3R15_06625 [Acidobacteriota bacterium]|nr:hypothetical protein [Acidobacteriota bacterium]